MAPLHRAVALAEVDDVACVVGEHLHLDVARVGQVALDVDGGVVEELLALARGALERLLELFLLQRDPEALAAAPAGSLAGHRVADLLGLLLGVGDALDRRRGPRDDRDAGLGHQLAGAGLRSHRLDRARRRPDERHSRVLAGRRERGVLGQEPVPGVDRLGARPVRRLQQLVDVEVTLRRNRRPEQMGLIGLVGVRRVAVGLRVDANRHDPHLLQGPHDPDRDFAPVGDQDLLEHGEAV